MAVKLSYFIIIFCAIVFFSSYASSLSSNLQTTYLPGESAVISLSSDVRGPLSPTQVRLIRGNVDVPFEHGVVQIGSTIYIWFQTPFTLGNYSFRIDNVVVTSGSGQTLATYTQQMNLAGEHVDYAIFPGALIAYDDFSIRAVSYSESPIEVSISFPQQQTVQLYPGENMIDFSLDSVSGVQQTTLQLGRYAIPALLYGNASSSNQSSGEMFCGNGVCEEGVGETLSTCSLDCSCGNNQCESYENSTTCAADCTGNVSASSPSMESCSIHNGTCSWSCDAGETRALYACEGSFDVCCVANLSTGNVTHNQTVLSTPLYSIEPKLILGTILVPVTQTPVFPLKIQNFGSTPLDAITFDYNPDLFVIWPRLNVSVAPNSSVFLNISVRNFSRDIKSVIGISLAGKHEYVTVRLNYTRNATQVKTSYTSGGANNTPSFHCGELAGVSCSANERCSGQTVSSSDVPLCCVGGSCVAEKESSYAWVGWVIAALVVGGALFALAKYRKAKPSSTLLTKTLNDKKP